MLNLLLTNSPSSGADSSALDVAIIVMLVLLIIVGLILCVAYVIAFFMRISLISKYRRYNREETTLGVTAEDAARHFLDKSGLNNVKVEQCNIFRAIIWGNSYSSRQKTIFLRRNIYGKKTLTALALAVQLCGEAVQDKAGDKKFLFVNKIKPWLFFGPTALIPLILVGVIIDLLLQLGFIVTIVTTITGMLFYILGFLVLLFTIPVYKRSIAIASELFNSDTYVTEEEKSKIDVIYKVYLSTYISEFVVAFVELIFNLIKFVLKFLVIAKESK